MPTKIFAEQLRVSAPLVCMVFLMTFEIRSTSSCMSPKWYRIEMKAAKKMIVGMTWKKKI